MFTYIYAQLFAPGTAMFIIQIWDDWSRLHSCTEFTIVILLIVFDWNWTWSPGECLLMFKRSQWSTTICKLGSNSSAHHVQTGLKKQLQTEPRNSVEEDMTALST